MFLGKRRHILTAIDAITEDHGSDGFKDKSSEIEILAQFGGFEIGGNYHGFFYRHYLDIKYLL